MKILILCHAFNSLSQRVYAELAAAGHSVSVELDIRDDVTREAVSLFQPDVVVAPFLKRLIPEDVWQAVPCLIIHPGPPGDQGPNALDWAILEQAEEWGVSIIKATGELDGGPILASRRFPMRPARKSSLYRFEVTEAAVSALLEALEQLHSDAAPANDPCWRGVVPRDARRIDWHHDDTATVLRKINSADGQPGALASLAGQDFRVFDARPEPELNGNPGDLLARCRGAICVGTRDGALWLGKLQSDNKKAFKRRATDVLALNAEHLTEAPAEPCRNSGRGVIAYREYGPVGVLEFDFYNGAMATCDCLELLTAWTEIRKRSARVIVLAGGSDFWSNGMDLNTIEAADSAADESWANINAMDDLAQAIVNTTDKLTVSALGGSAAAGGVFLALAADQVWARDGIVLNPHYKNMGNLYGSELWSYLLPRRVGTDGIGQVMAHRLPMLAAQARTIGLIDRVGPNAPDEFRTWTREQAEALAGPDFENMLADKRASRQADETEKPIAQYRAEELERMKMNFYGFDPSYHVARYRLVQRTPHAWTPLYLAQHRRVDAVAARLKSAADEG